MKKTITTLCLIHQSPRILLGMKKRGFGAGRWNGFGGKIGEGEIIEQAAIREFEEEAGITPIDMTKRGVMNFYLQDSDEHIEVHLFGASRFTGEPRESEEMKPQWFDEKEIPFGEMWPDDKHWFPLFVKGKNFNAHFYFSDQNTIVNYRIEEI